MFVLPSCSGKPFTDPWKEREDEFPKIEPQKEKTEEEIIESEKQIGIERFEGLKYFPQDDAYYLWGCYEKFETLTIPDTYKGKPVIGIYWQEGLSYTADTLTELHLGKNIKGLSSLSFNNNALLTKIIIDESNEYYQIIDNVLYLTKTNNDAYPCSLIWVLPNKSGELEILEGVGPFDDNSLKYANKVTSIHLPNSMPNPYNNANYSIPNFSYCSSLKEFKIDEENQNYQVSAGVLYTKDMKNIISYPAGKTGDFSIPEQIEDIYVSAFDGTTISSFILNEKISNFKTYWLRRSECESIECNKNNINYSSIDGCLYSKDMSTLLYVPNGKININISNTTKTIKHLSNEKVTFLVIPNRVTSIEYTYLPNLKNLVFGSNVKKINEGAFYWISPIEKTFYNGSTEELSKIELGNNNPSLVHSTRYYYSKEKPTVNGNYWHYVDNRPVIW